MFAIMHEPERLLGGGRVDGGVTHAVNTDHVEDIYFFGDMARVCLVSGTQFNVTRHEASFLLDALDNLKGGDAG